MSLEMHAGHPEMRAGLTLEQRLLLHVGKFEQQLLDVVQFKDIDLENPDNFYHKNMLYGLVRRESEETGSLMGQIVEESGQTQKNIEKIIVESFSADDVSLDVGTKRNVDRFILQFEGGNELVMTVSLDKFPSAKKESSPSFQETAVLQKVKDPTLIWSVQRWLGSSFIEYERDKMLGLICKEFIPGQMLGNFTADIESTVAAHGVEAIKQLAYETGRMVANARAGLGGVPIDSNSLNIIVTEKEDKIITRYCDVEGVRLDKVGIEKEIGLLRQEFGLYSANFVQGLKDNYRAYLNKVA